MKVIIKKYALMDGKNWICDYQPKTYKEKIELLNKILYLVCGEYQDKWETTYQYKNNQLIKIVKEKETQNNKSYLIKYEIIGEWC